MTLESADADAPVGDPERAVTDCLTELANNAPPDVVLTRLRLLEGATLGPPLLRARYLRARAIAANRLGFPTEALGDLLEARNLLLHDPDRGELVEIIRTIALVQSWRGDGREAALALLQAVAVAGSDPSPLSAILMEAGRLHLEIGRPQDAELLLSRGLTLGALTLPAREQERGRVNLVQALVSAGRSEAARQQIAQILPSLASGSQRLQLLLNIEALRVAIAVSDLAAAREALKRANEFVEPDANAFSRVELAHAEAELVFAEGDAARAEPLVRAIIARYADGADDLAPREIRARLLQADVLDALQRPEEADRTLSAALRRSVVRGLVGFADQVRSRIASRDGSDSQWVPDTGIAGPTSDPAARFVRRRRLGGGAYGSVERAYDLELGVEVALKRMTLHEIYDTNQRRRLLESAKLEVAAASRVQHPGVVRIYGMLIAAGGDALIIEELVDGQPLRHILDKPLPPARALDLLSRIAFALAAIHATGIVHRDLKPENVMLRGDGSPVIIDFGVAVIDHRLGRAAAAGTKNYMAPEQARGGRIDGRADLYALGVIASEMLTGQLWQPPHSARFGTRRAQAAYRRTLGGIGLDGDTADLLAALLAPGRRRRPRSATLAGARLAHSAAAASLKP